MARTLEEIMATPAQIDQAAFDATTEADIARQAREDGSEPAAPLSEFVKRRPGQRGPGKRESKEQVTFRIPADAMARWRASGPGWQTRIGELIAREAPKAKRGA